MLDLSLGKGARLDLLERVSSQSSVIDGVKVKEGFRIQNFQIVLGQVQVVQGQFGFKKGILDLLDAVVREVHVPQGPSRVRSRQTGSFP